MINYDDLKAQLIDMITISDMAISSGDQNSTYATLNVINRAMQHLVDKLEERENQQWTN
ncbi:TPA: hypothetical protein U1C40_000923 [Streptococcus suis]|nr:hypothetical protein [Streptococcus suis]